MSNDTHCCNSMLQAYTNDFKYDLTCLRFSLIIESFRCTNAKRP